MPVDLSRRCLVAGLTAVWATPGLAAEPLRMTAAEAHAAAGRGDVLLLDIRTPQEWRQTGIGATAMPVSMHKRDFLQRLEALTAGDKSRPVALICAVGGRSNGVQRVLSRMGYTRVYDVAEGMIGGVNGTGWLRSGLPVRPYVP